MQQLRRHTVNGWDFETYEDGGEWYWHRTSRRQIGDRVVYVIVPDAYGPFESLEAAVLHAAELLDRRTPARPPGEG